MKRRKKEHGSAATEYSVMLGCLIFIAVPALTALSDAYHRKCMEAAELVGGGTQGSQCSDERDVTCAPDAQDAEDRSTGRN